MFFLSIISMVLIRVIIESIGFLNSALQYAEYIWLFYGVILGVSFSFFVSAIPRKGEVETPKKICESFKHYFSYFFAFFVILEIWGFILLVVIVFLLIS